MDKVIYRTPEKKNTERKETVIDAIFNTTLAKIVLMAIAIFLFYNIYHSVEITVQKVEILTKARVEVESLRLKNLELASLLKSMQSVEYLEVEARDRLNFSSKKDIVFVIPENLYSSADEYIEKVVNDTKLDEGGYGVEAWMDFLMSGI